MEPIWKETIVDCPIHGKRITKIPIFPQNTAFNTKYYAYKNTGNYYTAETEPSNTNNSSFFYKANSNRSPYINYNTGRNRTINNNINEDVSLSNAYKSSLNNPIRIYGNGNAKYEIKSNAKSSMDKPVNIKNSINSYREKNFSGQQKINSNNKSIVPNHSYNKLDINKKESKAFYRRRNEDNYEQKRIEDKKEYNKSRKNKYSFDLKVTDKLDNEYINKTYSNINISNVAVPRKKAGLNNGIKNYSSKTNDVINKRIIITEPRNVPETSNNSIVVDSTNLNNYKFYISRDNYLNNNNKAQYSLHSQPIYSTKRGYSERNNYNNISRTDYDDDYGYDYNASAYYEINQYMNKRNNNKYNINYGYNDNGGLNNYDRTSPLYNNYNYTNDNQISAPIIQRKYKKIKIPYNTEINEHNINNIKKKKKILKFKVHDLKELRENEFKIEKRNNPNEKDDENVEEHVEKYFDKDGNCIGGKKIIIKQEYDNGQKIIKKFVEEKYKQDSDYEILKKQGENNYLKQLKNQEKKETIITSTIKSSNNEEIEANNQEEENNNINTIVTFGMNSKKEDDLENIKEEKEADEQKIEVNSEFEEEEDNEKNEDKNEIVNNANENDNDELSKSPEEDNNSAILEEMNKENGGINNEIKDLKDKENKEENNLNNNNIEKYENEDVIDDKNENNM